MNFRIVIPEVLHIAEDTRAGVGRDHEVVASFTQRLVVRSNLSHGFCVRLTGPAVEGWQVRSAGGSGPPPVPSDGGWRACATGIGVFEWSLAHTFSGQAGLGPGAVQVELSAL